MRKELIRNAIIKKATSLFAQKGYAATTLQDVADEMNMSRSSVYYYFRSKEDILSALVKDVTLAAAEIVKVPENLDADGYTRILREDVSSLVLYIANNAEAFRVLAAAEIPKEAAQSYLGGRISVLDRMSKLIEGGINIGAFRKVDVEIAALGIMGIITWIAWWFKSDSRISPETIAEEMADMALRSISRTSKGEELQPSRLITNIRDELDLLEKSIASLAPSAGNQKEPGSLENDRKKPKASKRKTLKNVPA